VSVVLTGAGKACCAGQDLHERLALLEAGDRDPLCTVTEHYNRHQQVARWSSTIPLACMSA